MLTRHPVAIEREIIRDNSVTKTREAMHQVNELFLFFWRDSQLATNSYTFLIIIITYIWNLMSEI